MVDVPLPLDMRELTPAAVFGWHWWQKRVRCREPPLTFGTFKLPRAESAIYRLLLPRTSLGRIGASALLTIEIIVVLH